MRMNVRCLLSLGALAVCLGAAAPQTSRAQLSDDDLAKIREALPEKATAKPARPRKLMVFSRCEGFNHTGGIAGAAAAFRMMGEKTGAFTATESTDMAVFEPGTLNQYDAVVFNNSTALKFESPVYRQSLSEFVRGGKGVIGIHAATDNFYDWPEGAEMMGALFAGHPWGRCAVKLDDPGHPLLRAFEGKGFWINEEMYKLREPYSRERLRVLLSFDMDRMTKDDADKGRPDRDNPIAWIQDVGKGRVFYCSLGHDKPIFMDKTLLAFYLDGIQYALGDLPADATPSAKLSPQPTPAGAPEK